MSAALENAPSIDGQSKSKMSKNTSRALAMVGVFAIAGVAFLAASSEQKPGRPDISTTPFSTSFAIKGTKIVGRRNIPVEGDAWLSEQNQLEWWLDNLEESASGDVRIHSGRSCSDLGRNHWDARVGPDPWGPIKWKSNKWGESWGRLPLDKLPGAYPFAGNLEHAIAVYSTEGDLVACGILAPEEEYVNFGVYTELNNGFIIHREDMVAGEVILTKRKKLSFALYNLEKQETGKVAVFAGTDCTVPCSTLYEMEWKSNMFGIAYAEVDLSKIGDNHLFEDLIGRAVAVYDTIGNIQACNALSEWGESTPWLEGEAKFELRDIQYTYVSSVNNSFPIPTREDPVDITKHPAWEESWPHPMPGEEQEQHNT